MIIRVLLADDHRIIREGLRALLAGQEDMEVVAEADNGQATVSLTRELKPDIVVMDVSMPNLNGIEATRKVLAEVPGVKVIALSMHRDEPFVEKMLCAGASGYLLKDCAAEELCDAIRAVVANHVYLSPDIAGVLVKDYLHRLSGKSPAQGGPSLTPREREVLQLVAEGKTSKQIASILDVSVKTVDTHRRQIAEKLNLHSVAELTKYAIREGLTSLEG